MKRFNTWDLSNSGSFWSERFKPKTLLRTAIHSNSVLAHQQDSELIGKYDIAETNEHTVGRVYTWVPITIDEEPIYLGDDNLFPWEYNFDPKWIFIDAIYDKHVDPDINLQHDIDFLYSACSGKVQFAKKIPTVDGKVPPLYISKGWYSEYRIYNEIGHFLDYIDTDSTFYRDSIAPILAALYKGPTYVNLLAILNVMIGLPVAKFGDEKVTRIESGIVTTDKYSYAIGGVHTSLNVGDTLYQFQPITDAVELNTHEHKPYWWLGHPVDVFARYLPKTTITNDIRDSIMENYLFNSVANVAFAQDRLGDYQIEVNKDIQNIFLKAAPSRSDFLFCQDYNVGTSYDFEENKIAPHYDYVTPRINVNSLYGRKTTDLGDKQQFIVSSLNIPRPTIQPAEKYVEGESLKFGDGIWHILSSKYDSFYEFWRYYDNQNDSKYKILVEPWSDYVYIRNSESTIPEGWNKSAYIRLNTHNLQEHTPDVDSYEGTTARSTGSFSNMTELTAMNNSTATYNTISACSLYGTTAMESWELYNISIVAKGATITGSSSATEKDKGYLITSEIKVGGIPKYFSINYSAILPTASSLIDFQYSFDKTNWTSLEPKQKIKNVQNNNTYSTVYFKINLYEDTQVLDGKPTLQSLQVDISID